MDSIKEQKEIAERLKFTGAQPLGGEFQSEYNDCCESAAALWPELLDWAERARTLLAAYKVQFNELRIPCYDHGDDCGCDFCDEHLAIHGIVSKLLEELPE